MTISSYRFACLAYPSSLALAGALLFAPPAYALPGRDEAAATPAVPTPGDDSAPPPDAAAPAAAPPQDESNDIIVTARKRTETLQDVPISIQALNQKQLEQLNVRSFEDYVRFTPSVSFVSQGPGQSKIVIRGVTESPSASSEPSAALYLDETPITSDGGNPDPRMIDIERVEVLSGPQGTLYGASSQSGTVRIITNKPDPTKIEGDISVGGAATAHGKGSFDINGVINLPIIEDKLALRVVAYRSRDAGFIDNILGTTPIGTRDDANVVRNDVNRSDTTGGRAALKYDFTPGWSLTAGYMFQHVDTTGRSDYDPAVGDLETVRFFGESFKDRWSQTSLTLNGDLGFADLVATGAYFSRKTAYTNDNTAYNQFLQTTSYAFPLYDFGADPIGYNKGQTFDHRTSAEVRLSSKDKPDSRWNWIVGGFFEHTSNGYDFNGNVVDFADTPGFAAAQAAQPGLKPTDTYFYQVQRQQRTQYAVFGELTYNFTQRLSLTLGGRWFHAKTTGTLHTELPLGASAVTFNDAGQPVTTLENSQLPANESGFTPKVNARYKLSDDLMFYATFSQGFRLGGANRQRPGLAVPVQYKADKLTNYEAGFKAKALGGKLSFSATGFFMTWDDFQAEIRNPDPNTFFTVTANVGQATIYGGEGQFDWRASRDFTLGGSITMLHTELTAPAPLLETGVPKGARLPVSPNIKFAVYGEYKHRIEPLGGDGYIRVDFSHTGDSVNDIDPSTANVQKPYNISDLQIGLTRSDWGLNLYINNLWDERAQLYVNATFFSELRITPNRPREIGVTLTRHF